MSEPVFGVVAMTLGSAAMATLLASAAGIPLGYLLARHHLPAKSLIAALIMVPMVIPPTATGLLLLWLLGAEGPFGDVGIVLTRTAVMVAMAVMALPLIVRSSRTAFEEVDPRLEALARTAGLTPSQVFPAVTLPLAARGLGVAALLGFARAIGEYGATVTVAGSIPGRTQTIASALVVAQDGGRHDQAVVLIAAAFALGLAANLSVEVLARR